VSSIPVDELLKTFLDWHRLVTVLMRDPIRLSRKVVRQWKALVQRKRKDKEDVTQLRFVFWFLLRVSSAVSSSCCFPDLVSLFVLLLFSNLMVAFENIRHGKLVGSDDKEKEKVCG
jgi:hypothetical protein